MSVRVLVIDDTPANLRLLRNKLRSRYIQVDTATGGEDGIELARKAPPDVVLLDVMMPGLNGFDTCRAMKADPVLAQVPVVLVTSLQDRQSRLEGLAAGADDFLSRPVDDAALFHRITTLARVASGVRQLEARVRTVASLGAGTLLETSHEGDGALTDAQIILADTDDFARNNIAHSLRSGLNVQVIEHTDPISEAGLPPDLDGDLLIVNVDRADSDNAFYAASNFSGRMDLGRKPVIALCSGFDEARAEKAERSGVSDCVIVPFDPLELAARVSSLLRRAKYLKVLEDAYRNAIDAALTDELTGLYNRRFASTHIAEAVDAANSSGRTLGLMMIDLDDFKLINDRLGHEAGDNALRSVAQCLRDGLRQQDMVARWGGDEFLVMLPDIERAELEMLGKRLLKSAAKIKQTKSWLDKGMSLSIGAALTAGDDSIDWLEMLRQADRALYRVKESGKSDVALA